jgi:uncharacterized OB-fold protein
MDYLASITYKNPVSASADRVVEASREHKLVGLSCPTCGRVYASGNGYCPIDALPLGPDREVPLPQTGTITNFAVVTPVQYPGQTETEPFARVFVLLDDTDVVITYSPTVDLAADAVHVCQRVRAVWAEPGTGEDATGGGMTGSWGDFLGWTPTGEPDAGDPDLVNRIF